MWTALKMRQQATCLTSSSLIFNNSYHAKVFNHSLSLNMRTDSTEVFYSFFLKGEIQESKFQLDFTKYHRNNEGDIVQNSDNIPITHNELNRRFIRQIPFIQAFELEDYLKFHYNRYSGNKNHFLKNTKFLLQSTIEYQRNNDSNSLIAKHLKTINSRYYTLMDICLEWVNKKVMEVPSTPPPQKMTSYYWENDPDNELPELFKLMTIEYKLIAQDTPFESFKAIFTGQPIVEGFEPVRWHDSTATELLYLIDKFEKTNNIKYNNRSDYQKLKACFVKPDGKPFHEAFKSLKTNLKISLSEDKQKAIDKLIENFL